MARHSTAWIARAEWISLSFAAACSAPGTPRIDGVAGAPPSPAVPWAATAALTADSASTGAPTFSLVDVVDLALRNNPATRESWALAQSAASEFGAARGALFPDINGNVNVSRTSSSAGAGFGGAGGVAPIDTTGSGSTRSGAGGGATRTQLTPAISLSYLVFDFGGRSGTIEAAKQRAIAADLTHDATINDVVL